MADYTIIVINTDPICENSVENVITGITACSRYFLQLDPASQSKGPFDIYLNSINTTPLYDNITREQFLIGITIEIQCTTPTPTPTITPTVSITPSITPTISITPSITRTPTITPTITITPTPTRTKTPTPTPTITPTVTPTTPEEFDAYLFIEPVNLNADYSNWMSGNLFRGFSNGIGPSTSATTFNDELNRYISFSGWGITAPQVRTAKISQNSGGFDEYGNTIQAYLFKTHEVPAYTTTGYSWYTWVIPNLNTNRNLVSNIGVNEYSDPAALVPVNMNMLYASLTVEYSGFTIPQDFYHIYTTFSNTNFRLINNNNKIYFRGNSLIPDANACNCFDVYVDPTGLLSCGDVCRQEPNTQICGKTTLFDGSIGQTYYVDFQSCLNNDTSGWGGSRNFSKDNYCYSTNSGGTITGATLCPTPTPTPSITPTLTPTPTITPTLTPTNTITPTVSITPSITPTRTITPTITPTISPSGVICFNPGGGFDDSVNSITQQIDGNLLIGGGFTDYSGLTYNRIIRININGIIDNTFNIGLGFNNTITDIKQQVDNKILVTGYFTTYSGLSYNRLIRLNVDGSIDTSFVIGSGFSTPASQPNRLLIQPDGKIISYGFFTSYNGSAYNRIIRLNTDGSIDGTFSIGSGFNSTVYRCDLQSDGKLVCVGAFTSYNGSAYNRIIRLNTDGSIDGTFSIGSGFGALQTPSAVKIQSDGKIIVTGSFTSYNGSAYNRIVRINTNGSVDTSFAIGSGFNTGGDFDIELQADSKIIVAGRFSSYSGVSVNKVVKLNTDGSIDSSFMMSTTPSISELYAIKLLSNSQIMVGGYLYSTTTDMIYRVNNDGTNSTCVT